eukprot:gnl/TRDRNA2_/TRDRNA2_35837_c0_seq1.p1 gnl/TRDRNA2_/TRDRNA2_35837_c0~~gnl/TRDRNA2_/TRDRNA2_35837_c0_seq1.p1  ORF type:complete len:510 (-),score=146.00 gnl/TRDRNA2_/TRDRNA2_35837_c0_seq1:141-1670(-)
MHRSRLVVLIVSPCLLCLLGKSLSVLGDLEVDDESILLQVKALHDKEMASDQTSKWETELAKNMASASETEGDKKIASESETELAEHMASQSETENAKKMASESETESDKKTASESETKSDKKMASESDARQEDGSQVSLGGFNLMGRFKEMMKEFKRAMDHSMKCTQHFVHWMMTPMSMMQAFYEGPNVRKKPCEECCQRQKDKYQKVLKDRKKRKMTYKEFEKSFFKRREQRKICQFNCEANKYGGRGKRPDPTEKDGDDDDGGDDDDESNDMSASYDATDDGLCRYFWGTVQKMIKGEAAQENFMNVGKTENQYFEEVIQSIWPKGKGFEIASDRFRDCGFTLNGWTTVGNFAQFLGIMRTAGEKQKKKWNQEELSKKLLDASGDLGEDAKPMDEQIFWDLKIKMDAARCRFSQCEKIKIRQEADSLLSSKDKDLEKRMACVKQCQDMARAEAQKFMGGTETSKKLSQDIDKDQTIGKKRKRKSEEEEELDEENEEEEDEHHEEED